MKRELLIQLRGKRSQSSVAKEIGITQQSLSYIECGKRIPRLKTMRLLSQYYGKSIEELFADLFSDETKQDTSA